MAHKLLNLPFSKRCILIQNVQCHTISEQIVATILSSDGWIHSSNPGSSDMFILLFIYCLYVVVFRIQ